MLTASSSKGLAYRHVLAREVTSAAGRPLYYLVFASDHDAGKAIMKWEFEANFEEQDVLFNPNPFIDGLIYDPARSARVPLLGGERERSAAGISDHSRPSSSRPPAFGAGRPTA